MYFVTYLEMGVEKVGILNQNKTGVIHLEKVFEQFSLGNPPKSMQELIEIFDENLLGKVQEIADKALAIQAVDLKEVKLCAPIPYPKRNIFCVGKNYADHAKEVGTAMGSEGDVPENPIYFSKIASPATGDGDVIVYEPDVVRKLDYEVELGVIIGKEGKNIPRDKAEEYIFGYTIINDVSERGLQKLHVQWHKGKSLDTFCPMGPYLVHKSVISFPVDLEISCSVNGEIRQQSKTSNFIFDIPTIIEDLSKGMTLKPGDIIATGTPAGVAMGFIPPKFLKPGDVVTCTIEKIGSLTNFVK